MKWQKKKGKNNPETRTEETTSTTESWKNENSENKTEDTWHKAKTTAIQVLECARVCVCECVLASGRFSVCEWYSTNEALAASNGKNVCGTRNGQGKRQQRRIINEKRVRVLIIGFSFAWVLWQRQKIKKNIHYD